MRTGICPKSQPLGLCPAQPYQAVKCPVCEGRGLVHAGFYSIPKGVVELPTTSAAPEQCRSCLGKGII